MNIAIVRLYSSVSALTHDIRGDIILKGELTDRQYSFLNMIGAEIDDTVVVAVRNTIMYGLVTGIERDAHPKDVTSEFFKPILAIISSQKVTEYFRLRHIYRQVKMTPKSQYDSDAYVKASETVEHERVIKRLAKNMAAKMAAEEQRKQQIEEAEKQARHQLYIEAAARKAAEDRAVFEEREQLGRLEFLLAEVQRSLKLMASKGIKFKSI